MDDMMEAEAERLAMTEMLQYAAGDEDKFEREPLDHTVVVYYYAPEQTEVHQGLFEYIPPLI